MNPLFEVVEIDGNYHFQMNGPVLLHLGIADDKSTAERWAMEANGNVERYCQVLREALQSMIEQFAFVSDGKIHTGGLSALECAFDAMGWDDPHPAPKYLVCDEPGCGNQATCGWPLKTGYRRTCGNHMERQ
mgnify:CR=1 FL=1